MPKTPTFELRNDPNLRIVRVAVEYPPDATPDAPLPGPVAPAVLVLRKSGGGKLQTNATRYGFDLPWPGIGDVYLVYRDAAGRTMRSKVSRGHLGVPDVVNDYPWNEVIVSDQDVRHWPTP